MTRYLVRHMITTEQWVEADSPEEAIARVDADDDHSGDLADSGIWVECIDEGEEY